MSKFIKTSHPLLTKEWDHNKNTLNIEKITYGSNKLIWWLCKNRHSWQISPKRRTQEGNFLTCPECNSLSFKYPKILEEWDYEKNIIKPKEISYGSKKKIWWICKDVTCNYSWCATPLNRTGINKSGCPMCNGMILNNKNRLSSKHPDLIEEWHPTKNANKDPSNFFEHTRQKVWWICKDCNYEYKTSISSRVLGHSNCSACSGRVVTDRNRLSIKNPELLSEWHPNKNGDLKPANFSFGSGIKVWWKCANNHSWKAVINNRASNGAGCPECKPQSSKLEIRIYCEFKEIFQNTEWRLKINKKEIDVYLRELKLGIEIDGYYWHKNKYHKDLEKNTFFKDMGITIIRLRVKPLEVLSDNDIIIGVNESHFSIIRRLLKQISIKTKNNLLKNTIKNYINNRKFINDTAYKRILTYLPGPTPENSLLSLYPNVAKQWNYKENYPLRPEMFYSRVDTRVSWICKKNKKHIWTAPISSLTAGRNCAFCDGKQVLKEHSFGAHYNKFIEEFDFKKNTGKDPYNYTVMSQIRVWWKCKFCKESFNLSFASRTKSSGVGCKKCRLKNIKPRGKYKKN